MPAVAHQPVAKRLLLPGLVLTLLLAAVCWYEWLVIGVVANPATIRSYMFGSEAMVGEGGPHYATAEQYARTALREALLLTLGAGAFGLALKRRTALAAVAAYGCLLLALILSHLS
ncbi:hypothetical protein GCM10027048_26670 [Hymenobacter coalescens]